MRSLDFLCPALLALSLSSGAYAARKSSNSALLSTVKTLTLRKDLLTTHRRVSAIPQVNLAIYYCVLETRVLIVLQ